MLKFIIILISAVAFAYYAYTQFDLTFGNDKAVRENENLIACTAEAKLCPDGSAVGRTGPDCEFAACTDE